MQVISKLLKVSIINLFYSITESKVKIIISLLAGAVAYADYFCWGVRPPSVPRVSWEWHKTASDDEAPVLEHCGMWNTLALPLLPGPLWPGVVEPVRVPCRSYRELFNHWLYFEEATALTHRIITLTGSAAQQTSSWQTKICQWAGQSIPARQPVLMSGYCLYASPDPWHRHHH